MYFTPLYLLALCFSSGVFASPLLEIDPVSEAGGRASRQKSQEDTNQPMINAAAATANTQIAKMKTVLADPTNERNKGFIVSAFGQGGLNNIDKIKETVKKIGDAKIPTKLGTQTTGIFTDPNTSGGTNWVKDKTQGWKAESIGFGKKYFDAATTNDARAGTLIHEAAHFAAGAGDDVDKNTNTVLKGHEDRKKGGNYDDGYTTSIELPKTPAGVSADTKYTGIRDSVSNMHDNAESYAVFASLCGQITRRDLPPLRRAVEARDYEEARAILRRNAESCELPPDYFEKKAAAAKAAKASKPEASKAAANLKKLPPSAGGVHSKKDASKSPLVKSGGKTPSAKLGGKTSANPKLAGGGRKSGLTSGGKTAKTSVNPKLAGGRGVKGGKTGKTSAGRVNPTLAGSRGVKGGKSAGGKTGKTSTARVNAKLAGGIKGGKSAGGKTGKTSAGRVNPKLGGSRGVKGGKSAGGKTGKTSTARVNSKLAGGRGIKGGKSAGGKTGKTSAGRVNPKLGGSRGVKGGKSAGGKASKTPAGRISSKLAGGSAGGKAGARSADRPLTQSKKPGKTSLPLSTVPVKAAGSKLSPSKAKH